MELGIYWSALQGWDVQRLRQACQVHVTRSKWFPKLSELSEAIGHSETDAGAEAWVRVIRAVQSVGRYRSVDFGQEENAAVMALGGWSKLCLSAEKELPFLERRFLAAYDHTRRAGVPGGQGRHLIGEEEADHVRLGTSEPPEVLRIYGPASKPAEEQTELTSGQRLAGLVAGIGSLP